MRPIRSVGIIGLGYVGLPLAQAFHSAGLAVKGFDVSERAWARALQKGVECVDTSEKLYDCDVIIAAVPTGADKDGNLDLRAWNSLGPIVYNYQRQNPDGVFVVESTVGPGMTDALMAKNAPELAYGYSPERVAPAGGDKDDELHGGGFADLAKVNKLVAGSDPDTLMRLISLYEKVITQAGVIPCSSIKVAEFSKCLENTQRDVNIALMNEMQQAAEAMGVPFRDVLGAANTKYNFHDYRPGLVGGHCIPVDPHYLIKAAEKAGASLDLTKTAREVSDRAPHQIAEKIFGYVSKDNPYIRIYGVAYKADSSDARNSGVWELAASLVDMGADVELVDPYVQDSRVIKDPALSLQADATVFAVPHTDFFVQSAAVDVDMRLFGIRKGCLVFDLTGRFGRFVRAASAS